MFEDQGNRGPQDRSLILPCVSSGCGVDLPNQFRAVNSRGIARSPEEDSGLGRERASDHAQALPR